MNELLSDAQTNVCYFSQRLIEYGYGFNIARRLANSGIKVKILYGTRDIWCRDFMPIQIAEDKYIGYEYTPDYLCAEFQTNPARINRSLGIDVKQSGIILDGGNVVKTSKGIIMVDKVFEENRHIPRKILIKRLENYFEAEIIFLPWDKEERYGHSDGIVREISDGRVLMTNYHHYDKDYADRLGHILSQYFEVEALDYNVKEPCKYNWCYINFLRVGNKVFIPHLTWEDYSPPSEAARPYNGTTIKANPKWYHSCIKEDIQALQQFQRLFTDCEIIPVSCPQIVEQGGALNCISWNIKK